MKTSYLIKPFEQHPDYAPLEDPPADLTGEEAETLAKIAPSYFKRDDRGEIIFKKGKPVKNSDFKNTSGFRNPFWVDMVREIRSQGAVETVRFDGVTETTGIWIDFGRPKEEALPLKAMLSFRYGSWSEPMSQHPRVQPHRYCYVTVEWAQP